MGQLDLNTSFELALHKASGYAKRMAGEAQGLKMRSADNVALNLRLSMGA